MIASVDPMRLVWCLECRGPDGCFESSKGIIWQADCGCWVFKCLLCGNVDQARCTEDEDHWAEFEYLAVSLT